ncbi:hypothetical protein [Actinoplanes awajinensis]|uniref:Uncharacterized protein n=1 Tax=Actinoplanes awajinensis subsp. mycoplanecinus TaxID=135947 RepID=A0A101JPP7_9ACTN|nr:hypothetical protein [Actinoplanes awajinensis]KUL30736.1 hypothetical protein ADL15_24115 [Actinoplanes awajinensis subsp. mycoplanecinus]
MGTEIEGTTTEPGTAGVKGTSDRWNGVFGVSVAPGQAGVAGVNENTTGGTGNGIYGRGSGQGVWGHGAVQADAVGVCGVSDHNDGVRGYSSTTAKTGVLGVHQGEGGRGVAGVADKGQGVSGVSVTSHGVFGRSEQSEGVRGESNNAQHGGVVGVSLAAGGHGVYGTCDNGTGVVAIVKKGNALYAKADEGTAGTFDGDVVITGDLRLNGADYAESLTVADPAVTAGMVVVIDAEGRIRPCVTEYDTRVAGVVSGAGGVKPAIVLDRHDGGVPVALMGKLWVLADATSGPIRCGDLLTTSSTPGHARRVTDPASAIGAMVGKALTELDHGTGLVRVLVSAT